MVFSHLLGNATHLMRNATPDRQASLLKKLASLGWFPYLLTFKCLKTILVITKFVRDLEKMVGQKHGSTKGWFLLPTVMGSGSDTITFDQLPTKLKG